VGPTRLTIARHDSALGRWEIARRQAAAHLRGHVSCYVGYLEATPGPLRRREVPGADVTLIISLGPTIEVFDPARRGDHYTSFVTGLWDGPALTEHAGFQHGVEVNLTPLGAHSLLGLPMHHLANAVVKLDDLIGAEAQRLAARLDEAPGWAARFDLLDAVFGERLARARPASSGVAWAWGRLRATHGAITVAALTEELGWSRRHLGAQFHEQIGLPPKLLARILRFDRVVALLRDRDPERWAEVAYACGYYDQAHFNRDFRQFAGATPTAFLASRLPDGAGFEG
jgi:AraC-like DNA-binding protein